MISVIIPFRNSYEWIDRCLYSLHNQDEDFEFILINDHSNDGGEKIVEEYASIDHRIILRENDHKPGVSGARNTGLDYAKGEWITFLDADDEMLPHAYTNFLHLIEQDPSADLHQSNHMRYYAEIGKKTIKHQNEAGHFNLDNLHKCKCWCMVWNKLCRRSAVEGIRFDESMQYGEDELFILECMSRVRTLHHGSRDQAIIMRHFDNKQSLSRIKAEADLFKQAEALTEFIKRTKDPAARVTACMLLSEHWKSETYIKTMAGLYK